MTEHVIYKYPMNREIIRVPWGTIRHIGVQSSADVLPTVWVEHNKADLDSPDPDDTSMVEVMIVGTGQPFDFDDARGLNVRRHFVATVVCAQGRLVWHCWQRPVSGP